MKYTRIAADVFGRPWAILPSRMEAIVEVLDIRMAGGRIDEDEIRARLDAAALSAGPRSGGGGPSQVALIPTYGVLSHRMNLFSAMSGGTSVQQLRGAFRQALADPDVAGIVFDVDSPGGSVEGIPELASEIRAARGRKPMVAVSNTLMASAAYWLASQADEIIVSPSSLTGSIGVVAVHEDRSAANEQAGVRPTYIHAGKHKVEGNPDEPLGDDARAYLQGLVDDTYAGFTTDVAKGRGVAASVVRGETFGEGRVLMPADAVKAGMADRVGTIEDAVTRISRGKVTMRAETPTFLSGLTYTQAATGWTTTGGLGAVADWGLAAAAETETDAEPVEATAEVEQPDPAQQLALARARARRRAIPA